MILTQVRWRFIPLFTFCVYILFVLSHVIGCRSSVLWLYFIHKRKYRLDFFDRFFFWYFVLAFYFWLWIFLFFWAEILGVAFYLSLITHYNYFKSNITSCCVRKRKTSVQYSTFGGSNVHDKNNVQFINFWFNMRRFGSLNLTLSIRTNVLFRSTRYFMR